VCSSDLPSFYRFISEILRFNRQAPKLLNHKNEIPLGQYLKQEKYSPHFINNYLIPMGSAIWSTDPVKMLDFPAQFFIRFFHNHGMLSIEDRPQWQVIRGGSARYVEKLVAPFREKIQLNTRVESVLRHHDRVVIAAYNQAPENYDAVFFACHSDQALKLIVDATPLEQSILGSIRYQPNEVVLHTDIKLLPHAKHAWAAWNYHVIPDENTQATLTYNMNILQNIQSQHTFCVTLNRTKSIDPNKIIKRLIYDHPLYTPAAATAQKRQHEINGVNRSFFCGAYWGNGFHEDGVVSSINALDHFNKKFNTYA
jgi:predicted NAD/FAD-binding protein